MNTFMVFIPLIVAVIGALIATILTFLFLKDVYNLNAEAQVTIITIILVCTMVGVILSTVFVKNKYYFQEKESYYAEIDTLCQNGYTVYIDGSAVDFDKIVISDYSIEKIHINDELKEIYISK